MWSSLPEELVFRILQMIRDDALPTVTRLDKGCNRFTRERLSIFRRLTQGPFDVKTSRIFDLNVVDFAYKNLKTHVVVLADAFAKGALDHLTVCWRPAALFPCLETLHTHSPDQDILFDAKLLYGAVAWPTLVIWYLW